MNRREKNIERGRAETVARSMALERSPAHHRRQRNIAAGRKETLFFARQVRWFKIRRAAIMVAPWVALAILLGALLRRFT
jgi:hypothetical protein